MGVFLLQHCRKSRSQATSRLRFSINKSALAVTGQGFFCAGYASRPAQSGSDSDDHHLGSLNQGRGGLSLPQLHFAHGPRSDQRRNELTAHRYRDLGDQSANAYVDDAADELVTAADALVGDAAFTLVVPPCAVKQTIDFCLRDAVMGAGGFDDSQFAAVDPLLNRGIADLQLQGRVARTE